MLSQSSTSPGRRGDSTRARIVAAAERMLVEQGARAATTRALAQAAGCAEGTLYVHFPDRPAIFAAVFESRWPVAAQALADLQERVGQGKVVDNLTRALGEIGAFLTALQPLVAAIKSDPSLAHSMHQRWSEVDAGPHQVVKAIAAYVAAEQSSGRAALDIDPETAGEALIGFLFYTLASPRFDPTGGRELTPDRLRKLVSVNVRPLDD